MINDQFLELLRAGLWGRNADPELFRQDNVDWHAIRAMAELQTVSGLVWDGVLALPKELRPSKNFFLEWYARIMLIEKRNHDLNRLLPELYKKFDKTGITPVLLKGQGVGSFYIHPDLRTPGDIDLYIYDYDSYDKAWDILSPLGGSPRKMSKMRSQNAIIIQGIIMELHSKAILFHSPGKNRLWGRFENETLKEKTLEVMKIEDVSVFLPPPDYNLVYMFAHAFKHIRTSGIGLRQICDIARYIHVKYRDFDVDLIEKWLNKIGLKRSAEAITYIMVSKLGLSPQESIINIDNAADDAAVLWRDILTSGNFGRGNRKSRGKSSKNSAVIKGRRFKNKIKRSYYFMRLAPVESLFYPISSLWLFLRIKIDELTSPRRRNRQSD